MQIRTRLKGRRLKRRLEGRTWRHDVREGLPYLAWVVGFPVTLAVIAWLAGLATSFGRDTDPEYYVAMATLLPVLLVAFLVEGASWFGNVRRAVVFGRPYLQPRLEELSRQGKAQLMAAFPLALLGEAVALYAIAKPTTTTFLLVASGLSALGIFALLALTFWRRL
jgi:hypothetical protein